MSISEFFKATNPIPSPRKGSVDIPEKPQVSIHDLRRPKKAELEPVAAVEVLDDRRYLFCLKIMLN